MPFDVSTDLDPNNIYGKEALDFHKSYQRCEWPPLAGLYLNAFKAFSAAFHGYDQSNHEELIADAYEAKRKAHILQRQYQAHIHHGKPFYGPVAAEALAEASA